ncbi:MAG: hypothetical protein RLZZ86_821 [Cyanobacteriota bacterium]|jgi:hypothetical protein
MGVKKSNLETFYSVSQSNCVPFGKQATIITACTSLEWE